MVGDVVRTNKDWLTNNRFCAIKNSCPDRGLGVQAARLLLSDSGVFRFGEAWTP
jgi:hypothetical protein